jgi:hypothetical protein
MHGDCGDDELQDEMRWRVLDAVEDVVYTMSVYGAVSDEFAYAYTCGWVEME